MHSKVHNVNDVGIGAEEVLENEKVKRSTYLPASISLMSCWTGNAAVISACPLHGMCSINVWWVNEQMTISVSNTSTAQKMLHKIGPWI